MKPQPSSSNYVRYIKSLVTGNVLAGILSIAATALNARALGAELFGILAVLQALTAIIARILSFDTGIPLSSLGAVALSSQDYNKCSRFLTYGIMLDILCGLLAAASLILVCIAFGGYIGIPNNSLWLVFIMSVSLPLSGTAAVGALRLFNDFQFIAVVTAAFAALSLIAAVALWLLDAPLHLYVVVLSALSLLQGIIIFSRALRKARFNGVLLIAPLTAFRDSDLVAEFGRFSTATWAVSTVNTVKNNADTLVVSAFWGPSAAGVYRLAMQLSSTIMRIADPIAQVLNSDIYTLSRSQEKERVRSIVSMGFLSGFVAFVVVAPLAAVFAEPLLRIVGGLDFETGAPALILLSMAYTISINYAYIRPSVTGLYGPAVYLQVQLLTALLYLAVLFLSVPTLGIAGAGTALLATNGLWAVICIWLLAQRLNISARTLSLSGTQGLQQGLAYLRLAFKCSRKKR